MTEVSVETFFANLKVLSLSLNIHAVFANKEQAAYFLYGKPR